MNVTVAAIQMASTGDIDDNLEMAKALIQSAKAQGAELAVLPENFATLGLPESSLAAISEEYAQGKLQHFLQTMAKEAQLYLVGGTLPIKAKTSAKAYASSLMYAPNGECIGRYDKIHLFDVTVSHESYQESDRVTAGESVVLVDTPLAKVGLTVCYDVRFPELYRALMMQGAEIICVPSAFTVPTGKAHWEILLRARAIENLCYIIAPNQVGKRANGLGTYGHSMIISPWGDILAQGDNTPGVVLSTLDLNKLTTLRQEFPSLKHYRNSVMAQLVKEVNK